MGLGMPELGLEYMVERTHKGIEEANQNVCCIVLSVSVAGMFIRVSFVENFGSFSPQMGSAGG